MSALSRWNRQRKSRDGEPEIQSSADPELFAQFAPGRDAQVHAVYRAFESGYDLVALSNVDVTTGVLTLSGLDGTLPQQMRTHRVDEFAEDLARAVYVAPSESYISFASQNRRYLALPVGQDGARVPEELALMWKAMYFVDDVAVSMPIDAPLWDAQIYSLATMEE